MVTERPTVLESWSGKKLGFSQVGSGARGARSGWRPVVVVLLSPSKMRAESKGVRAGSEAMHSDTRARKQATSTVPLSSVQPCQAEKGKSTSRSQSTVRHVYKSNYEIKDVRAAWKAMHFTVTLIFAEGGRAAALIGIKLLPTRACSCSEPGTPSRPRSGC